MSAPWIFPALAARRWAALDLDALARRDFPETATENPLNEPEFCERWVRGVTAAARAEHSWGGWLEDRTHLWRGHYLPEGCSIHLGIDLNVPAGTAVLSPLSGEVMHAVPCRQQGGGWGGWFVLRADAPAQGADYLLFGHLAHDGLPPPGARIARGALLGHVGTPAENGGWFPHLHLQAMAAAAWDEVAHAPDHLLDGYAHPDPALARLFPDPAPLVGLPGQPRPGQAA